MHILQERDKMAYFFGWHMLCPMDNEILNKMNQSIGGKKMIAKINRNYVPTYWDDFFNDKFFNGHMPTTKKSTSPAVNVIEDETHFSIEVAAPGVSKEDFKINLENDLLTISTKQSENKEEVEKKYLRKEFSYSTFKRSFQLPDTIDVEKIRANHDSGILTIELPKKAEVVQNAHREIEVVSQKTSAKNKK